MFILSLEFTSLDWPIFFPFDILGRLSLAFCIFFILMKCIGIAYLHRLNTIMLNYPSSNKRGKFSSY